MSTDFSFGHSIIVRHEGYEEGLDAEDPAVEAQDFYALDPTPLIERLIQQNRPIEQVQKCNRFILPVGEEHGRGWILMRAVDAKRLWLLRTQKEGGRSGAGRAGSSISYRISLILSPDGIATSKQITIKKLDVLKIESVTGYSSDYWFDPEYDKVPLDPGLAEHFAIVHLVDQRYTASLSATVRPLFFNLRAYNYYEEEPPILENWKSVGLDEPPQKETFLTRKFLPWKHVQTDGSRYDDDPTDSYSAYTWEEVVKYLLWYLPPVSYVEAGGGIVNGFPVDLTMAQFPEWLPVNLNFTGSTVWKALCEVLHYISHVIYRDLDGNWFIASTKSIPPVGKSFDFKQEFIKEFLEDPRWIIPRNPGIKEGDPLGANSLPVRKSEYNNLLCPYSLHIYAKNYTGRSAEGFYPTWDRYRDLSPHGIDDSDGFLISPVHFLGETILNDYADPSTAIRITVPSVLPYLSEKEVSDQIENIDSLFRAAKNWTAKFLHATYIYYHSIECGNDVSAVQWYNVGHGPRTEILRKPLSYTPGDEKFFLGKQQKDEVLSWENSALPNIARELPPVTRFVSATVMEDIKPNINWKNSSYGANGKCRINACENVNQNLEVDNDGHVIPPDINSPGQMFGKWVRAYNPFDMFIPIGSVVLLNWSTWCNKWFITYVKEQCQTDFFTGILTEDLCPSDISGTANIQLNCSFHEFCEKSKIGIVTCQQGSFDETYTITIQNPYRLSGKKNSLIFGYYKRFFAGVSSEYDYTGEIVCTLLQVEHQKFSLVERLETEPAGSIGEGGGLAVDCSKPDQKCILWSRRREFSAMTCQSQPSKEKTVESRPFQVLTSWYVDGLCIRGTYQTVWSMCACYDFTNQRPLPAADVLLHRGTDCAGGSCTQ